MLWFNLLLLKNQNVFVNYKAVEKGLIYIEHIWNGKSFLMYEEVCINFHGCITWLQYAAILSAIPDYWKFLLQNENLIDDFVPMVELLERKNVTKLLYRRLIPSDTALKNSACKWATHLNNLFDYSEHVEALQNIYQITNVTKLLNFQFKLLHGIVFCNNILYYWKFSSTQLCDFCQQSKQDVCHLLVDCEKVKTLWYFVNTIFSKMELPELTIKNIIYNNIQKPWLSASNFIILATKFYIYKCKIQNTLPWVRGLVQDLDLWYQIEMYNASIDGKLKKHERKWSPVTSLCK